MEENNLQVRDTTDDYIR